MGKMSKLERHGKSVLEAAPVAPPKSASKCVRIYYKSEGGELLCVEAAPLTHHAASELVFKYSMKASGAVHVESGPAAFRPAPWGGARIVVFPSHAAPEAVEAVEMKEAA